MRVLLRKLKQRIFGYCLKHDRYTRYCPACHIDRLLQQPAINPSSPKDGAREIRLLQKRFDTLMAVAIKEALRPTINEEQFEAWDQEVRRWHEDHSAWSSRYAGPLKLSTHFDCESGV